MLKRKQMMWVHPHRLSFHMPRRVAVRVPVDIAASKGLNGHNYPGGNAIIHYDCLHHLFDRLISTAAQTGKKPSIIPEIRP